MVPEVKKKIKVYAGIPSTGERVDAQMYWWRRMEKLYGDKIDFIFPEIYIGRIFHDCARNAYVEQFLESDADILFFLDSDVVPMESFFDLITVHGDKWDLAGAPYPVWMTQPGFDGPQLTFTVYKDPTGGNNLIPAPIPETGLDFVNGIATGCILIRRKVLEQVKKPYFEFKYNPETREMTEGEDLGFCRKVNELGYKFFIDYSMPCHHFKKLSLLDVSNFLENQKQMIIESSDRMIRQAAAKMQLERMNKQRQVIEKPSEQSSRIVAPPHKSRLILPK